MTGIAMYLIQEVINNALLDLDRNGHDRGGSYSAERSKTLEEAPQQSFQKKGSTQLQLNLLETNLLKVVWKWRHPKI